DQHMLLHSYDISVNNKGEVAVTWTNRKTFKNILDSLESILYHEIFNSQGRIDKVRTRIGGSTRTSEHSSTRSLNEDKLILFWLERQVSSNISTSDLYFQIYNRNLQPLTNRLKVNGVSWDNMLNYIPYSVFPNKNSFLIKDAINYDNDKINIKVF